MMEYVRSRWFGVVIGLSIILILGGCATRNLSTSAQNFPREGEGKTIAKPVPPSGEKETLEEEELPADVPPGPSGPGTPGREEARLAPPGVPPEPGMPAREPEEPGVVPPEPGAAPTPESEEVRIVPPEPPGPKAPGREEARLAPPGVPPEPGMPAREPEEPGVVPPEPSGPGAPGREEARMVPPGVPPGPEGVPLLEEEEVDEPKPAPPSKPRVARKAPMEKEEAPEPPEAPPREGAVEEEEIVPPPLELPPTGAHPVLADVFFDYDRYMIRPEEVGVLEKNAEELKTYDEDWSLLITGHCDERGTSDYNLVLGERRAQAAKRYLVNLGVPASQIAIISYGKENPFCTDHTQRCWQLNRRAHFLLKRSEFPAQK